jgi:hypothetical protein
MKTKNIPVIKATYGSPVVSAIGSGLNIQGQPVTPAVVVRPVVRKK